MKRPKFNKSIVCPKINLSHTTSHSSSIQCESKRIHWINFRIKILLDVFGSLNAVPLFRMLASWILLHNYFTLCMGISRILIEKSAFASKIHIHTFKFANRKRTPIILCLLVGLHWAIRMEDFRCQRIRAAWKWASPKSVYISSHRKTVGCLIRISGIN